MQVYLGFRIKRFGGIFQLTSPAFKRTCHVDPQSSGILLKTFYSFPLKLAPKLSFICAFWHKPMWELRSTQPTQSETLTRIRSRTSWKLLILLFPVDSVFYPFSCHIQKSNAFIMIVHCQQCALHCAIRNTTGRVFSRDKVYCSLANDRQWDCRDFEGKISSWALQPQEKAQSLLNQTVQLSQLPIREGVLFLVCMCLCCGLNSRYFLKIHQFLQYTLPLFACLQKKTLSFCIF